MANKDEFTLDMSDAHSFDPMPKGTKVVAVISGWKYGQAAKGLKVDMEFTVTLPTQYAKRKIWDSPSLANEFGKGRLMNILVAIGRPREEILKKDFKLPTEKEMLGQELTLSLDIEESAAFGDRNKIKRVQSADAYQEATPA